MVAATLMWIAESGRLREPLEYCLQFGEIVQAYAYLKAMSYQFCCMVQALAKSPNQSPPNFKSLWTDASAAFFTFIGPIPYLKWIYWKWQIDVTIKRHKWGWVGHTLRTLCTDKLCNRIRWMVLKEERVDPARLETNCGKGVQESKQILVWFKTTGPVKS